MEQVTLLNCMQLYLREKGFNKIPKDYTMKMKYRRLKSKSVAVGERLENQDLKNEIIIV